MAENPPDFPPPSSLLQVAFGAHSRRNQRHAVNEDHYVVVEIGRYQSILMTSLPDNEIQKRFDESAYGMVVADGIGPAGGGEPGSRLALETLMKRSKGSRARTRWDRATTTCCCRSTCETRRT